MQDTADFNVIFVGHSENQEVARAANSAEGSINMIAAVPKMIGLNGGRNIVSGSTPHALRLVGNVDHCLNK